MSELEQLRDEEITRGLFIKEIRRLDKEIAEERKQRGILFDRYEALRVEKEKALGELVALKVELARLKEELRKRGMLAAGKAGLDAYGYYEKNPLHALRQPPPVKIGTPPDVSAKLDADFWGDLT